MKAWRKKVDNFLPLKLHFTEYCAVWYKLAIRYDKKLQKKMPFTCVQDFVRSHGMTALL